MTYQTQLVLLDKEGNTVYPYAASETEQETVIWTEEAVKRADTAMEAEENGEEEDVYAVGITTQMYENGTAETMKQYDAVIGEQQYTLVVIGGMKAVSQGGRHSEENFAVYCRDCLFYGRFYCIWNFRLSGKTDY